MLVPSQKLIHTALAVSVTLIAVGIFVSMPVWHQTAAVAAPPVATSCSIFSQSQATNYLGTDSKLSQVTHNPSSSRNLDDVSCTYVRNIASPTEESAVVVGIRTPQTPDAIRDLKGAFFQNVSGGEVAVQSGGLQGFAYAHDTAVELRAWVNNRWLDAHSGSLEDDWAIVGQLSAVQS